MKWLIAMLDFRLWQGNGNGGGDSASWSTGWVNTGEGGQQRAGGGGGTPVALPAPAPVDTGPPPRVPVIREARNVQRANIDRSSLYDPTAATQQLGADYLQSRNASNPQPQGATGAGAVGYEFLPSNERLY